jgi:hypothetical protein
MPYFDGSELTGIKTPALWQNPKFLVEYDKAKLLSLEFLGIISHLAAVVQHFFVFFYAFFIRIINLRRFKLRFLRQVPCAMIGLPFTQIYILSKD